MIVDDDDVIALGLQDYLQLRGCAADTAHDYETAKTLLGRASYAVALVDVVVTGHDEESGAAFLRWLRDASPSTAIVVLTAFRTTWLEDYAQTLGVLHVFDKPKPFDEIVNLVWTLGVKYYGSVMKETV